MAHMQPQRLDSPHLSPSSSPSNLPKKKQSKLSEGDSDELKKGIHNRVTYFHPDEMSNYFSKRNLKVSYDPDRERTQIAELNESIKSVIKKNNAFTQYTIDNFYTIKKTDGLNQKMSSCKMIQSGEDEEDAEITELHLKNSKKWSEDIVQMMVRVGRPSPATRIVFGEAIVGLRDLTTLSLINCAITEIPYKIYELVKLETLNLKGNNIKDLPESLLTLEHLVKLDVRDNPLKSVPHKLARNERLDILSNITLKTTSEPRIKVTVLSSGDEDDSIDDSMNEVESNCKLELSYRAKWIMGVTAVLTILLIIIIVQAA